MHQWNERSLFFHIHTQLSRGLFHGFDSRVVGVKGFIIRRFEFEVDAEAQTFEIHAGSGRDETSEDVCQLLRSTMPLIRNLRMGLEVGWVSLPVERFIVSTVGGDWVLPAIDTEAAASTGLAAISDSGSNGGMIHSPSSFGS